MKYFFIGYVKPVEDLQASYFLVSVYQNESGLLYFNQRDDETKTRISGFIEFKAPKSDLVILEKDNHIPVKVWGPLILVYSFIDNNQMNVVFGTPGDIYNRLEEYYKSLGPEGETSRAFKSLRLFLERYKDFD